MSLASGTVSDRNKALWRRAAAAAASELVPWRVRPRLLRALGCEVDDSAGIHAGFVLLSSALTIEPGAFLNYGCLLDNQEVSITIGERAFIGPRAMLLTTSHEPGPREKRAGLLDCAPIRVEAGAWIGAGAIILPGVTVGTGAIVGAGAVVTRDVPPDERVAGSPARAMEERLASAEN